MKQQTKTHILAGVAFGICVVVAIGVVMGMQAAERRAGGGAQCPADYAAEPPLIVVSLDGFKAEYRTRGVTPRLQQLLEAGVSAPYLIPSYPTLTFPNHYTIVTGLYPEAHGIIANKFYDPNFNAEFALGSDEALNGRWWGGEPVWNTITRQNKKSAVFFWPGSDANINDKYPTYWRKYDGNVNFQERIDQVLEWVTLPKEERPVWIGTYFDEPDHTGHASGPDSPEVDIQLARVDAIVGRLIDGLVNASLFDCVNLIILADHGMALGGEGTVVNLSAYIPDISETAYTFTGGFTRIEPKDTSDEVKYDMMRKLSCKREGLRQYEKAGLPTRLHFSNNMRIEPIVLDMDAGMTATVDSTDYWNLGNHGYDNHFASMKALFLAHGPGFVSGQEVKPFQNIELYNLMCSLTGIAPAPNNGTPGALAHLLTTPYTLPHLPQEPHPPVAPYPEDDVIQDRLGVSGCSGDLTEEEPWLEALSLTLEEQHAAEVTHLPWGFPQSLPLLAHITILHHTDHVTAYSQSLKVPLWSSFTVSGTPLPPGTAAAPWSSDVRLTAATTVRCDDYPPAGPDASYFMEPLFPPMFSSNNSLPRLPYLVSNAAPSTVQQQRRWHELMAELLPRWLHKGSMNIVVGPLYDLNADSFVDNFTKFQIVPKLPSDWFAVLTRCTTGDVDACQPQDLDAVSFIYPTEQAVENCLSAEQYALEFSSTGNDVSKATGLTFYPALGAAHRIRLLLHMQSTLWSTANAPV